MSASRKELKKGTFKCFKRALSLKNLELDRNSGKVKPDLERSINSHPSIVRNGYFNKSGTMELRDTSQ